LRNDATRSEVCAQSVAAFVSICAAYGTKGNSGKHPPTGPSRLRRWEPEKKKGTVKWARTAEPPIPGRETFLCPLEKTHQSRAATARRVLFLKIRHLPLERFGKDKVSGGKDPYETLLPRQTRAQHAILFTFRDRLRWSFEKHGFRFADPVEQCPHG